MVKKSEWRKGRSKKFGASGAYKQPRHDGWVSASLRGLATGRGNLSVVSASTAHTNAPKIAGIIFNTRTREGVVAVFWGVRKLERLRSNVIR